MPASVTLDETSAAFFAAFSNGDGPAPVDTLYEVCLPEAVIINATMEPPVVYRLVEFVEPRRELLSSGRLVQFREYEVSAETVVHDRIATRTVEYAKSWIENGEHREASGLKVISFVLTSNGWKIASALWQDRT